MKNKIEMEPNHNNDSKVYKSEKEERNYFMDILALSGRKLTTQPLRKSFMTESLFENKDSLKPELLLRKNTSEEFDTKSLKSFVLMFLFRIREPILSKADA